MSGIIDIQSIDNYEKMLNGKYFISENEDAYSYFFRIIPFSSLGNENGLLVGFEPDLIRIYGDEVCERKELIVGIYDGKLSKTHMYSALIGLNVLEEEKKYEFVKIA